MSILAAEGMLGPSEKVRAPAPGVIPLVPALPEDPEDPEDPDVPDDPEEPDDPEDPEDPEVPPPIINEASKKVP